MYNSARTKEQITLKKLQLPVSEIHSRHQHIHSFLSFVLFSGVPGIDLLIAINAPVRYECEELQELPHVTKLPGHL